MNDKPESPSPLSAKPLSSSELFASAVLRKFIGANLVLVAAFSLPLVHLVRFAFQTELYSHVILIPFISAYLVWMNRRSLPQPGQPDLGWTILCAVAGLALLAYRITSDLLLEDALAVSMLALVLLFTGLCAYFLGRSFLRAIAFPLGFLVFMAPFPLVVTEWIETGLQNSSAFIAHLFFMAGGTTVFRQETYFQLPGMKLLVAPECSGIHSTLALFITSLIAGYFFLRSPWKRTFLSILVLPLAILRNGFRVFVIGELCVHIGPEMIDSPIHHHGGPLFFILSLIPFFLILWLLIRAERSQGPHHNPNAS